MRSESQNWFFIYNAPRWTQFYIYIHLSIAPFNAIHTSVLYENAQNMKLRTELLNSNASSLPVQTETIDFFFFLFPVRKIKTNFSEQGDKN